jgi:hypothetical protein
VRSEAEIRDVCELFVATGDDPPALNTAVRDALTWVLGGIPVEELTEHYLVTGVDYRCFTCPTGRVPAKVADLLTGQDRDLVDILIRLDENITTFSAGLVTTEPDREAHIELTLLLLQAADRVLHRLVGKTPSSQTDRVAEEHQ